MPGVTLSFYWTLWVCLLSFCDCHWVVAVNGSVLSRRYSVLPPARDEEEKAMLDRMLRVDHAGEYGANRIYAGQMAILGRTQTGPLIQVLNTSTVSLDTCMPNSPSHQMDVHFFHTIYSICGTRRKSIWKSSTRFWVSNGFDRRYCCRCGISQGFC